MAILALKERKKTIKNVEEISINRLLPNPYTSRKSCNRKELLELAKSIGEVGVLQPVLVRKKDSDNFQIIAGERRVKASRIAGLKEVPCIVLGVTDRRSALFSVTENLQRSDVGIFEEAEGVKNMCQLYGMTEEDCAVKLGIPKEEVKNKMALLKLGKTERELCGEMELSAEISASLGKISDKKLRAEAFERLAKGELEGERVSEIGEIVKEQSRKIMKNSAVLGNKTLFFKTINRAVEILNGAGGEAKIEKISSENETVLLISVKN
ncbi:MAG: ParB/RepB/Spo0J family partition protein [Ruminococcus sp.]|nr:ParB/RepB/Spo0J family partition protein [Ruminococcus sp.]